MSFTIWFTGLSGAGKTTLSYAVYMEIQQRGKAVEWLDGDVIRKHFSHGLGFTKADRDVQVKRLGFIASLLNKHGIVCIISAIAPYRDARDHNRRLLGNYHEVHCDCPLDVLTSRDVKGLYKKALAGEIKNFTGISDPYEAPLNPELHIETNKECVDECVCRIIRYLEGQGLITPKFENRIFMVKAGD